MRVGPLAIRSGDPLYTDTWVWSSPQSAAPIPADEDADPLTLPASWVDEGSGSHAGHQGVPLLNAEGNSPTMCDGRVWWLCLEHDRPVLAPRSA